jgi:hypothetical protein
LRAPGFEQAVEPKAVIAGFVAGDYFHGLLQFLSNSLPDPLDELQQLFPIARLQFVETDLVRQRRIDGVRTF